MGTLTLKAKKRLACALVLVALCVAAVTGASISAPHNWSAVPVAYADGCDGGLPPPDLDCLPTPTPTATPVTTR